MGISKVEYNGETLMDVSGDTVTPETLAAGSTAHNSNGEQITGTAVFGGGNNNGDADSCTLAIPCVFDFTEMKVKNIYVDKQTIIDAFNANKYIYAKVDVSQIANGATSYTIAPLTQFVHIPDYDRYLIYFDFIMAVNGVPTNVNVQMIAGDTEGSVTMTPLAVQT